ncbi:MAG: DUF2071 domain-containing protein [Acidobacteria bacterium]|nr:DUF2071 domain-containing protein [Acidobacteriota bacterium]MBI3426159.1 DUF2071 domain-containing protein [Acidobacteriota bacterium]
MQAKPFLTAEWRFLAMLNYEVDARLLFPFLPRGTELDYWQERCYISMVGFLFLNTRLLGLPIPFHRNFEEINLRFYVRRKAPDGWRRGVVFIKEIVPRRAIATLARLVYNENYVARPMRHKVQRGPEDAALLVPNSAVEYGWREGHAWQRLRVNITDAPQPPSSGSEAEFITEHYWGYAAQRDGSCVEYQVEHPPWLVWQAQSSLFECDVARVYGPQFVDTLSGKPFSAFVAAGSPIVVRRGVRL